MLSTETLIKTSPLFHDLTPGEAQTIAGLFEQQSYGKGETILREGNSNQLLWVIGQGKCEVVKSSSGVEHRLAVLDQGAVFGEMSFFHPAPHSASIRTLSEVEVYRMWRSRFDELMKTDCAGAALKIAISTARVLSERLRTMDDWVCSMVDKQTDHRQREEWQDFRAKLYNNWHF